MANTTSRYGWPYQELTDAPNGAAVGQDLAQAVEATVGGIHDDLNGLNPAPVRTVYTASTTWNKPAGAIRVMVDVVGGGGAGGGAAATAAGQWSHGDGGGGGEYASGIFAANTLGASEAITIGAGGTAGTGAGTGGGTTSFGAHITALGGGAGQIRAATATVQFSTNTSARLGGSGGTGGDVRIPGMAGGSGFALGATGGTQQRGGDGGASHLGGNAVGGSGAVGNAGRAYGGGGSGASQGQSSPAIVGGNGAPGVCIITVWFQGP
jgi:hypothetical protein